jgi:hypothetical protein
MVPCKQNESYVQSSFKRGAMQFEDFNYAVYNPYILIEDQPGSR